MFECLLFTNSFALEHPDIQAAHLAKQEARYLKGKPVLYLCSKVLPRARALKNHLKLGNHI